MSKLDELDAWVGDWDEIDEPILAPSLADMPATVGAGILAALLGISTSRVSALAGEGVIPKISRGVYPLAEAIQAYCQYLRENPLGRRGANPEAKDRLATAQADLAELKLARARAELVPAAEVASEWRRIVADLRSRLLAVPSRVASRVGLDRTGLGELDAELRAALEAIADDG